MRAVLAALAVVAVAFVAPAPWSLVAVGAVVAFLVALAHPPARP